MERRQELGGFLPRDGSRSARSSRSRDPIPSRGVCRIGKGRGLDHLRLHPVSSATLPATSSSAPHVVPIVPDEARTFGMDSLFRELKIYASKGQLYEPVDASMLLSYSEARTARSSKRASPRPAHGLVDRRRHLLRHPGHPHGAVLHLLFDVRLPAGRRSHLGGADARARGFLLGGTAGRTTLQGEGLQHQDGHSLVLASTVPVCQAYDPAFAYEVGTIIEDGIRRMYGPSRRTSSTT
jgi:pyruvate dehydrogenase E1 component